jgi:3-oxoacyl-[acyl-carrier protein] reductase
MWGILGAAMETIYSMTKGGINAFTKALAKELKGSNIDVIAFALGAVDTDMNKHLSGDDKDKFLDTLTDKRMWTADEIADKIYDVVLNKKYTNGDILELNNGLV